MSRTPSNALLNGISLERLTGPTSVFASLTFPRYRPLLESLNHRTVAVAACSGLRPVGLALADYDGSREEARLLSLAVDALERRRGVGGALLAVLEAALAGSGCKSVNSYYSSRLPSAQAFQVTLRRCGWEASQLRELRSAGRCGALAAAIADWPGVRRLLRNAAYSIEPWCEVTAADQPAIDRLSLEPTCRPNMSPNDRVGLIEPRASVAIRRGGEFVGWVLTRLEHAEPTPVLHCDSAYMQYDLWRSGMLVVGYLRAYQNAAQAFGPDAVVRFSTGPSMPGMMALVRRRFAPVSLWVDEWLESRKALR